MNSDAQGKLSVIWRHSFRGRGGISKLVWSSNGHSIACCADYGDIWLWDIATGQLATHIRGEEEELWLSKRCDIAWSPDQAIIAFVNGDPRIRLFDTKFGKYLGAIASEGAKPNCITWNSSGRLLAYGSADGRLWIAAPLEESRVLRIINAHSFEILSIAWSPDEKYLATACESGLIQIWKTDDWNLLTTLKTHRGRILSLDWSKNGRFLASASLDRTIQIWDRDYIYPTMVLQGHLAGVLDISFSADDCYMISKSFDDTIRVWNCQTWETVSIISEATGPIVFSPLNHMFASYNVTTCEINIWELDLTRSISRSTELRRDQIYYNSAKVILVGDSGAGKSCLARALMGEDFVPQESTHGMRVWSFKTEVLSNTDGGQSIREIFLWDLAGQTDYQIIHQLFLDETAVGVVLFDATDPEDPFSGAYYWIKALRRATATDCPLFLVPSRVDRGPPAITSSDLKSFRHEQKVLGIIPTSAKTGEGVGSLRNAIITVIPWGKYPTVVSSQLFKDAREFLFLKHSQPSILVRFSELLNEFIITHPQSMPDEATFSTILHHAQSQGIIYRLSFGNLILLKPEILNDYASAIVRVARKHREGLGCVLEQDILDRKINFEDLSRVDNSTDEKTLLHAVIELFVANEIALRERDQLVFPSKFNRKRPQYPHPSQREVSYIFDGPIEVIFTTLIVRLYYSGAFLLRDIWKNAVEFADATGSTLGLFWSLNNEGSGSVSLFYDKATTVPSKVLFMRFIHEHIRKRALPGSIKRERIYRCQECTKEISDRDAVRLRLDRGLKDIICQFCDKRIILADLIEEKFGDPSLLEEVHELDNEINIKKANDLGLITSRAKQSVGEIDICLVFSQSDETLVHQLAVRLNKHGINPSFHLADLSHKKHRMPPIRPNVEVALCIGSSSTGYIVNFLNSFGRDDIIVLLMPGFQFRIEYLFLFKNYITLSLLDDLEDAEFVSALAEWIKRDDIINLSSKQRTASPSTNAQSQTSRKLQKLIGNTKEGHMPSHRPSRSEIRTLINQRIRSDSELNAFLIDEFPEIYDMSSNGMDRVAKLNILLTSHSVDDILKILIRRYPELQKIGEAE